MPLSLAPHHQADMRHAHYHGAPGVAVSALVWIAAAIVCHLVGVKAAIWTLLIGGTCIYPLSVVVTKAIGRPAATAKDNALDQLGMASTIWLIVCCALCYGLSLSQAGWFFPAMLATIGSRYLVFASLYGKAVYWQMGACLIVAGVLAVLAAAPPVLAASAGGAIELAFALAIALAARRAA